MPANTYALQYYLVSTPLVLSCIVPYIAVPPVLHGFCQKIVFLAKKTTSTTFFWVRRLLEMLGIRPSFDTQAFFLVGSSWRASVSRSQQLYLIKASGGTVFIPLKESLGKTHPVPRVLMRANKQHTIHKHCIQLYESTSILNTYIQHAIHKHCIELYVSTSILNTYIQHAIHKHCIQLYVSASILNTNDEYAAILRVTSARRNLKEATESQNRICCLCYQDRKLLCVNADR